MRWLILHIPHLLPAFLAFALLIKFGQWALDSPPPYLDDDGVKEWRAARGQRADAAPVRRRVAVAGLWALGPLAGAVATGLVIYSINLGSGRPAAGAVWLHVAVSMMALVLVAVKLASVGRDGLLERFRAGHAWEAGLSLLMALLLVPLLISGIALLVWPSKSSFGAYFHLVASAWWTALFQWHLWRYLIRAVRDVVAPSETTDAPADDAPAGAGAPTGAGDRVATG